MTLLQPQAQHAGAAIMVVEDERVVAGDIEDSLRRMGYNVVGSAASAEECLRFAARHPPDLVLMDVRIQGELDGIETAKLLRARFDVPVVYLTAYADDETVSRARETEAHGYLLKPFRATELKSAVEIALFKHRAESALRERERWFSTTLRAIGDAVIAVDAEGVVKFMNFSASQLLGRTEEEVKGQKFNTVFQLIEERTRLDIDGPLADVLRERRPMRLPPNSALKSGERELPIDDSMAPIVDDRGQLLGAVVVFRDVSEERKAQAQIALSDRLTSLGVLAAGVAHEINNPLTYVLGNASLAHREVEDLRQALEHAAANDGAVPRLRDRLGEVEDGLREIEHGAERIRRIVSDLRVFARPEACGESGDVMAAVQWALRVTEGQILQRARLVKALSPVPRVRGADGRLGQVFVNLLLNAAQAIQEGAPRDNLITVTTGTDERGDVVVSVRDTGPGMRPEVVKRIFEPFFTTKPVGAGTGLGLSICHGIVEAIGGELRVESALGVGSTFSVHLPVSPLPLPETKPTALRPLRRGRLLVIDDEPLVLASIVKMLSIHDVIVEESGSEALARLEGDHAFDAILCDLMLPGLSGMEFYARIGRVAPELAHRIVFTTGGAFSERANQFLNDVPNLRITKPFSQEELQALVQSLLYSRPR